MVVEGDRHYIGFLDQEFLWDVLDVSSKDFLEAVNLFSGAVDHDLIDVFNVFCDELFDVGFHVIHRLDRSGSRCCHSP